MNTIQIFILGATIVFFLLWQVFVLVKIHEHENKKRNSPIVIMPPLFIGSAIFLIALFNYLLPSVIYFIEKKEYLYLLGFLVVFFYFAILIFLAFLLLFHNNILIVGWIITLYIYHFFSDEKYKILDYSGLMKWSVSHVIDSPSLTTVNILTLIFISISLLYNILLSASKK